MSAHDAKAKFGQLLDAARAGPVAISKHGREVAVIISKEEFEALQTLKLDRLRAEVQQGIESIGRGDSETVGKAGLRKFADSIKQEARRRTKKP
jgi:prevent-host-death family protein